MEGDSPQHLMHKNRHLHIYLFVVDLFNCTKSWLWPAGSLVAAVGYSSLTDELGPLHWECGVHQGGSFGHAFNNSKFSPHTGGVDERKSTDWGVRKPRL